MNLREAVRRLEALKGRLSESDAKAIDVVVGTAWRETKCPGCDGRGEYYVAWVGISQCGYCKGTGTR